MTIFLRRCLGALACTGLVVVLSACSSSEHPSAAPAGPTSASPSPSPSASPSPTASATASPRGGTPTCQARQLRVGYADDAGGGAAGSVYGHLVLTNTSASPCAMTGWPGVSYVGGGDGTQLGAPADRTGRAAVIVLPAGGAATSQIQQSEAGNVGGSCSPATADGLRVYPPNSTTAVFVRHPAHACRSSSAHLLTVGPVVLR
jgi:hypothetical protein